MGFSALDFLSRHVVEIDYERREITIRDPTAYAPPAGAIVVPLDIETGWPIAEGTITTRGGVPDPLPSHRRHRRALHHRAVSPIL